MNNYLQSIIISIQFPFFFFAKMNKNLNHKHQIHLKKSLKSLLIYKYLFMSFYLDTNPQ